MFHFCGGSSWFWQDTIDWKDDLQPGKKFRPVFDKILYFFKHYQQPYRQLEAECLANKVYLQLIQGLEWSAVERGEILKQRILVVIDDLYDEAANNKEFFDLVIAGRHRNVHLMVLRHILFQQSKYSKTIDSNVTQIILFNSPRDSEQIEIWDVKRSTQEASGHLLIDLDVRSSKNLRYCSHCSGDEPSHFY